MIGAFKVLVRPYGSFVDLLDEIIEKGVLVHVPVVFQYDQSFFVDVTMDLTFRSYDYFFKRIQKTKHGFQDPLVDFFKFYLIAKNRDHSFRRRFRNISSIDIEAFF